MRANYKRNRDGSIGKRTVSFTEKQLQDYVNEQWELKINAMYQAATKDITAQVLAVMFATLYKPPYNWRGKRLCDLKDRIEATFKDMQTGILGKKFGTEDCIEFMKREFNIDFDKEVKHFVK